MANVRLVIFDVAGTTAKDNGLVVNAFQEAMVASGFKPDTADMNQAIEYVKATMGQRKIDVFREVFQNDMGKAMIAHKKFDESYTSMVRRGDLEEFEGVSEFFSNLNQMGIGVAITTGFPRSILSEIIEKLNWTDLVNISVASDEVNEGRPAPDMILESIRLYNRKFFTNIAPSEVVVVGDTDSDMQSGVRANVKQIVGVTSGAMDKSILLTSGATNVIDYCTDLLTIIN